MKFAPSVGLNFSSIWTLSRLCKASWLNFNNNVSQGTRVRTHTTFIKFAILGAWFKHAPKQLEYYHPRSLITDHDNKYWNVRNIVRITRMWHWEVSKCCWKKMAPLQGCYKLSICLKKNAISTKLSKARYAIF